MFHHTNGAQRLTGVELIVPSTADLPPVPARYIADSGAAKFTVGGQSLMILTLDNGKQGKTANLQPALPLIVRY